MVAKSELRNRRNFVSFIIAQGTLLALKSH